jgi:hypothetical protein
MGKSSKKMETSVHVGTESEKANKPNQWLGTHSVELRLKDVEGSGRGV